MEEDVEKKEYTIRLRYVGKSVKKKVTDAIEEMRETVRGVEKMVEVKRRMKRRLMDVLRCGVKIWMGGG